MINFMIDQDRQASGGGNKTEYVSRSGTFLCACSGVTLEEYAGKHKLRVRFVVLADNNTDDPMTGKEIHENLYLTEKSIDRIVILRDAVGHKEAFNAGDEVAAFNVFSAKPVMVTCNMEETNSGKIIPKVTYAGFSAFAGKWDQNWENIIKRAEQRAESARQYNTNRRDPVAKRQAAPAGNYDEIPF